LEVKALAPGLWRWTAPHPAWTPEKDVPGGWGQWVGCVFAHPPGSDAVLLIDPLVPPEPTELARFWEALDRDLAQPRSTLTLLVGVSHHVRSAVAIRDRYAPRLDVTIAVHAEGEARLGGLATRTFVEGEPLPGGAEAFLVEGFEPGEVVFHLPQWRTLVPADSLIGTGDERLAVAPEAWAPEGPKAKARYRERFRPSLRRLLALDPVRVLASHGEPALERGGSALARALDGPAWGES
jgi:hypothetical protein